MGMQKYFSMPLLPSQQANWWNFHYLKLSALTFTTQQHSDCISLTSIMKLDFNLAVWHGLSSVTAFYFYSNLLEFDFRGEGGGGGVNRTGKFGGKLDLVNFRVNQPVWFYTPHPQNGPVDLPLNQLSPIYLTSTRPIYPQAVQFILKSDFLGPKPSRILNIMLCCTKVFLRKTNDIPINVLSEICQ